MRLWASVAFSFLAAPFTALAAINGPIYPPTNGVTYVGAGQADSGAGRTNTYTDMSLDGLEFRWWGDAGTPIVNSLSNNPNDVVHFNAGQSDLAQGVAVYTGTSNFTYQVSGGGFVTRNVETRLTISTTDLLDSPIPMVLGSDLGIVAAAVATVDADDFTARLLFEARNPVNGAWTPTSDLFDSFNTTSTSTLTSLNAGFYEQPPCAADFNRDGGIDGTDVSAFFAAWEIGDYSADVNQDGGIDGSDVAAFFSVWEAGGC
jgi:hypothetical protein